MAKRGQLTESQKEQKAERDKAQMAQMLGGDAKTFSAQADDTYDKARDSKMYQGISKRSSSNCYRRSRSLSRSNNSCSIGGSDSDMCSGSSHCFCSRGLVRRSVQG